MRARSIAAMAAAAVLAVAVAGCGGDAPDAVRVGLMPAITHGPALIALEDEFAPGLAGRPVDAQVFASGPEEVSALLSGSLDAAYIGPGPYVLAEGRAPGRLRLLAGVVTGGQAFVARPGTGIRDAGDLAGRRVAVPAHGNTQDLTLRLLLDRAGLRASDQGGDVEVVPVKNAALVEAFRQGVVDAALAPAPFGELLAARGLAAPVPAMDRTIAAWEIPATVLVATEEFARANPAATRALVRASARAVARADAAPRAVALRFNDLLDESTGTRLDREVLLRALDGTHASTAVAPGAMERMVRAADSAGYAGGPVAPAALVPRAG